MRVVTAWKTEPLGEVVDFIGGGTPSRAEPSFWGGTIPWATVKDFKSTALVRTGESITEAGLRNSSSRIIKRGTLVMPTRMALGKVAVAEIDVAINQDLKALSPRRPIDSRFLLHALLARAPQIEARGNGATVKGITIDDLGALSLHYPDDEAEQRRIAAILDKADAIRARRRAALADADALARATFLHLFGDPVANPMAWPDTRVGDVAEVGGGLTLNGARKSNPIEIPYLRVANVYRERLELAEVKTIQVTDAERARTTLRAGDILVVEGHGNPAEVGRAALWDDSIEQCAHQNHLIRVRPDQSAVLPSFVSAWLNSEAGRRQMVRAGKTTSGLNTISISQVRSLRLALPSLDRQQRFEAARNHIERVNVGLSADLADAAALYASLAARAFRGEL